MDRLPIQTGLFHRILTASNVVFDLQMEVITGVRMECKLVN